MISIEKCFWLPKLKRTWEKLYQANPSLSIFQSYEFMQNFWKNSWIYGLTQREIPVFYIIREDGVPRMIAPLCKKHGSYEILGNKNGCEYCDFIYAEDVNIELYVELLLKQLKSKVTFTRIKESSILYKAFVGKDYMTELCDKTCVNIALPNQYEVYYKSLSSSVRQNLRTSFNRLKRDGHSVTVKVVYNDGRFVTWSYDNMDALQSDTISYTKKMQEKKAADSDFADMLDLYYQRHAERYGESTSKLKMWYMTHLNFMSVSLRRMSSALNIMLFVDNELAAFMSGLVSPGESNFIVPRLSINGKFGFYSPGMLLVNESSRYLIDQTSNRNLDLSLGTEIYKTKMGGGKHTLKTFELSPKESNLHKLA